MSRSRFRWPRRLLRAAVASQGTLPKLVTGIFQDGRLIGLAEHRDPREVYVGAFNEDGKLFGVTARALDTEEVPLAHKLLAERDAKGGAE